MIITVRSRIKHCWNKLIKIYGRKEKIHLNVLPIDIVFSVDVPFFLFFEGLTAAASGALMFLSRS
jgi:hypothetical protein